MSTHMLDLKERLVYSYLEGSEAMRMAAGTIKVRSALLLLMSLIFIGGMDTELQAHMLHPAVDVAL